MHGRRVVELGAGVGNSSLILAGLKEDAPKEIIATDFAPAVMTNLKHNVEAFVSAQSQYLKLNEIVPHNGETLVRSEHLDWSIGAEMGGESLARLKCDVIIAADCTYDIDICGHLANTVVNLLSKNATDSSSNTSTATGASPVVFDSNYVISNQNDPLFSAYPYALVACTVRTQETFECFLRELNDLNAYVYDVSSLPDVVREKSSLCYPTHNLYSLSEEEIKGLVKIVYVKARERLPTETMDDTLSETLNLIGFNCPKCNHYYQIFEDDLNCSVLTCNCFGIDGSESTMLMTKEVADYYNRTERPEMLRALKNSVTPAEYAEHEKSLTFIEGTQLPQHMTKSSAEDLADLGITMTPFKVFKVDKNGKTEWKAVEHYFV